MVGYSPDMNPQIIKLPLGDNPPTARLLYGATVIDALRTLPDESVHVICTSPPYWGLRDYGVSLQDWHDISYRPMSGLPELVVPAKQVALGLESEHAHYVGHLVAVFRELRRVLRKDGILWLNIGDSYIGHQGHVELKPKDMAGIPWRVALALQADGWYLRNDVVWSKGNCMPEPVKDRCTRSHEYVFMFSKSYRYFYDAEAIKEPLLHPKHRGSKFGGDKRHVKHRPGVVDSWSYSGRMYDATEIRGKNKRTVWNVNPRPYVGAHFAVWPPKLVEPMVKAGTSERGVCPTCGAPWKRITQRHGGSTKLSDRAKNIEQNVSKGLQSSSIGRRQRRPVEAQYGNALRSSQGVYHETMGWEPTCECKDNDGSS